MGLNKNSLKQAKEKITELESRIQANTAFLGEPRSQAMIRKEMGFIPPVFEGNCNLIIPSFNRDQGRRPVSQAVNLLNPSGLMVYDSSDQPVNSVLRGKEYKIRCRLMNTGDLAVPCAKVELFISRPNLAIIVGERPYPIRLFGDSVQVQQHWVNPGTKHIEFKYVFDFGRLRIPLNSKFVIAVRAFSFSPRDLPKNLTHLDAREDKLIANRILQYQYS